MSSSQPISMNERNVWRLSATPEEIARSNEVRFAELLTFFAFGFPARGFLGLTPFQGFFLALMVFLNVCVLGFFALVAFGRIQLPGL